VPGREGDGVIDPYYGGADGFEATWQDVSAAARALVARLA
jgi:protein-tyrosine phosphatase